LGRRENELFIGKQFLNIEGRTIKHPALISIFANINVNKTTDKINEIIGIDIETNHITGQMKLLGFFETDEEGIENRTYTGDYYHYTDDFLYRLFAMSKYCVRVEKKLGYWNKLDSFAIFRLFLEHPETTNKKRIKALNRWNKVSGEFDKYKNEWKVTPIISVMVNGMEFGIIQAIRSSIQLYFIDNAGHMNKLWLDDINAMYNTSLTRATRRFNWYSKVDKSAHLVDWERFNIDQDFRENIVLKSNMLDARACGALSFEAQYDFAVSNKSYPTSMISMGGLARTSIIAQIFLHHQKNGLKGEELKNIVYDDVKSIGIVNALDDWAKTDEKLAKDIFTISCEAYSGGMIEAIRYGYSKSGYYADLASAYPAIIVQLYDLRGSKLIRGKGTPPNDLKHAYIFIRGVLTVPEDLNYNPVTIKHPFHKETNIRASGRYKASYTYGERVYLEEVGVTFEDEEYIIVQTTGKLSPLADMIHNQYNERKRLISEGNIAEEKVKTIINSAYGIEYEATDIYQEINDEIERIGYRAGEFLNTIYACIITARTRTILSKACYKIEENGGKPIILMTDSITWKGTAEMLPKKMTFAWGESGVKDTKTLGWFEPPEKVYNIVCLGSGRYGYEVDTDKGRYTVTKRRGLNITQIDNDTTIKDGNFTWYNALKSLQGKNQTTLDVSVRSLVSVGMIKDSKSLTYNDLSRVMDSHRNIDLIVGRTKRLLPVDIDNVDKLLNGLIMTRPIYLQNNVFSNGIVDGTLSMLRDKMINNWTPPIKRKKQSKKKTNKKYRAKNHEEIKELAREKYNLLKIIYPTEKSNRLSKWSYHRIIGELKRDDFFKCSIPNK